LKNNPGEGGKEQTDPQPEKGVSRQGMPKYVQVIINPAAGRDQPVLKTINAAFQNAGIDWDVSITKKAGDGTRLAQAAVSAGVDAVLVHGGDGTVMEVARGVMHTGTPMAILPGGTANVMAHELGIPVNLVEAAALAVNPEATVRTVDMGQVGDYSFLLRAGMGFEAAMVEGADRELKDRLGLLAYALSALQELANPEIARYRLILDGQEVETEGLACIIANSGNVGASGLFLAPGISVSDGLLDVIIVTRSDLPSLVALAASVVGGAERVQGLQHWQVKEVKISSEPSQTVQLDGEILASTPIEARVVPGAVQVIVPPDAVSPGEPVERKE
jgi:diacylglycerol kinase (ATP)